MESALSPVIQEIISARSLNLISQDFITLEFGDGSFFVASIVRITLKVYDGSSEKVLKLLAKLMKFGTSTPTPFRTDRLFNNEFTFYEDYLKITVPELKELIPEYYYGNIDEKDNEWIVIEFLEDYRMYSGFIFLANDHVELACKELGKFHGIGYMCKADNPEKFMDFCGKLLETRCGSGALQSGNDERFGIYSNVIAGRGFLYLPNQYPTGIIEKYKAKFKVGMVH